MSTLITEGMAMTLRIDRKIAKIIIGAKVAVTVTLKEIDKINEY